MASLPVAGHGGHPDDPEARPARICACNCAIDAAWLSVNVLDKASSPAIQPWEARHASVHLMLNKRHTVLQLPVLLLGLLPLLAPRKVSSVILLPSISSVMVCPSVWTRCQSEKLTHRRARPRFAVRPLAVALAPPTDLRQSAHRYDRPSWPCQRPTYQSSMCIPPTGTGARNVGVSRILKRPDRRLGGGASDAPLIWCMEHERQRRPPATRLSTPNGCVRESERKSRFSLDAHTHTHLCAHACMFAHRSVARERDL